MNPGSKKVAIIQSSYIPWKGYFDAINAVDEFIFLDEVQYTKRDWRSRNAIKLEQGGTKWLSIPIKVKGNYHQRICEAEVVDPSWAQSHWDAIKQNYRKAPYFQKYASWVESLYKRAAKESFLSQINFLFIRAIMDFLSIKTKLNWSQEYPGAEGSKSERLLHLCLDVGAKCYLSGPLAKDYLAVDLFQKQDIQVEWINYENYPIYQQIGGDFISTVSIIDMIFNLGEDTPAFMKSFK